jgi:AcrR family transcriptional regulator
MDMTRAVRPVSRSAPEARRASIVDEAIRVIGQRGCYGFTIQELAQRCGLSNAGLLYHFGSREQILLAVLQDIEAREARVMGPLVAAADQAPSEISQTAVLNVFEAMVARASAQPELIRLFTVLQAESIDYDHPAHDWWRNRDRIALDLFARLVTPFAPDPTSTARLLVALLDGLIQHWLRMDQGFDLAAEWKRAISVHVPKIFPATSEI